jgi:hypothetical protein
MWISRESHDSRHDGQKVRSRPGPTLKTRALEAVGLAVLFAFLPDLVWARAAAVLEPHPGWIAVLILAARYGGGGFFTGLIAGAAGVGVGSVVAGAGLLDSWSRFDSGPNLVAFGACLTVSWVASWHLRRQADLEERLRLVSDRASTAEAGNETLRHVVQALRARADRTSSSLSFLRDVAARLDGRDPIAAAEGAADLALARTGANAAAVRVGAGGFQRVLAVRDARGPKTLTPLALPNADLTVPIRNGRGPVGVIALWGIPPSARDEATAHDLDVIAAWCVRPLSVAAGHPEKKTGDAPSGP